MSRINSTKYKLYILLLIVAFALFACEKKAEPGSEREAEYTQVYAYASICLLYPMDMTITEYDQGIEQMEKGQFFEASASMETALERQKKEFSDNKLVEGKILSALGVCNIALFENQKAEERLRLAQELILAETGNSSDETAVAYNNLASALLSLNRLDESMTLLKQAENIGQENATLSQLDIDCIITNQATNHVSQERHLEATTIYEQKLESINGTSNKEKLVKAFIKGKLAYMDIQNLGFKKAIKYCNDAIEEFKKLSDANHLEIQSLYLSMGSIYLQYRNFDKAFELFNKSLESQKSTLNQNPAVIALSYYNMGSYYDEKNEFDKAMEYYNLSLEITKKYQELQTNLAAVYNNIGVTYAKKNYFKLAESYILKAYLVVYGNPYNEQSQNRYKNNVKIIYDELGKDSAQFDLWLEQQKNNKEVFPDAA